MSADIFNLFFAIFPDEAAARKINKLATQLRKDHSLRGRSLAVDRFHISLQNLGAYENQPEEVIEAAKQAAAAVTLAPFSVTFNQADSFEGKNPSRHPLILRDGDSFVALAELHKQLNVSLKKSGLGRFVKPISTPHVTLLYGDHLIQEHPVQAINWEVTEFVLVWSHYGKARYESFGKWPLYGSG